jgi:GAF domain-containing protein
VPNNTQDDLIGLQNALLRTENVEQFLHELAVLSTRVVGEGLCCGLTLRPRGRPPLTVACSDPLASQAAGVQYELGDGPCLHAMRQGHQVRVDDMSSHERWAEFCQRAASLGLHSALAVPLSVDGTSAGVLGWYSCKPSAFGETESRSAESFAAHASGALTLALRLAACTDLNNQLRESMDSRAVIDQALGVIMATEKCPQDRAFGILRTVSQNTNVKLRDLASTIVASVSGEPPQPSAPFEDG